MAAGHARLVEPLSEQGAGAALRPLIAVEWVELGRLEGALPDGLELVEALLAEGEYGPRLQARRSHLLVHEPQRPAGISGIISLVANRDLEPLEVRAQVVHVREGGKEGAHLSLVRGPELAVQLCVHGVARWCVVRGPQLQSALPLEGVVAVVVAGKLVAAEQLADSIVATDAAAEAGGGPRVTTAAHVVN